MTATLLENALHRRIGKFVNNYVTDEIDMSYETRRAFPRYPITEPVDVMIDSYESPAEIFQATGRDISLGGLGLYTHRPIPAGTELIISIDNGQERLLTKAKAVHSTLSVGLFKIGVEFKV